MAEVAVVAVMTVVMMKVMEAEIGRLLQRPAYRAGCDVLVAIDGG